MPEKSTTQIIIGIQTTPATPKAAHWTARCPAVESSYATADEEHKAVNRCINNVRDHIAEHEHKNQPVPWNDQPEQPGPNERAIYLSGLKPANTNRPLGKIETPESKSQYETPEHDQA